MHRHLVTGIGGSAIRLNWHLRGSCTEVSNNIPHDHRDGFNRMVAGYAVMDITWRVGSNEEFRANRHRCIQLVHSPF
jgi:hypothetical protein